MRQALGFLARLVLVNVLMAGPALAGGVGIDVNTRFEFTDCSSSGSSAQTVTRGTYLLRITDEDVYLCWASTCASGGERFPVGTVMLISVAGQAFSCHSAGSTGDAIFTRAN